jgi:hypothetical protein
VLVRLGGAFAEPRLESFGCALSLHGHTG